MKIIEEYPQTLIKKTTVDLDEDGIEEEVELYTNAAKNDNGLIVWDDGQTWLLVVKDGEETYPLFNNYVQLGSIDFSVATYDGDPEIVIIKSSHSDRTVQKFKYDKKEKGYEKSTFYKKENINDYLNPPASYAFFKEAFISMETAFTTNLLSFLKADESNPDNRSLLIDLILVDLYNARYLLGMAAELNKELNVSLDGVIDLLHGIDIEALTTEQIRQLQLIHETFREIETDNLLIIEENKIHPEVVEKLQTLKFVP